MDIGAEVKMLDKTDRRRKDANWYVNDDDGSSDVKGAQLAVLMDIRDELKDINRKLGCWRVTRALNDLNSLGVATRRRRRKRK